jgi:hypothetical protein
MSHHRYEYNEEYRKQVQALVLSVAKAMLAGQIGIILGSRSLSSQMHIVFGDDIEDDFMIFIVIASETDALPVGAERQYWAKSVLLELDREIEQAEAFYEEFALDACRKLIEKFE